jgi:hypothetical protein
MSAARMQAVCAKMRLAEAVIQVFQFIRKEDR